MTELHRYRHAWDTQIFTQPLYTNIYITEYTNIDIDSKYWYGCNTLALTWLRYENIDMTEIHRYWNDWIHKYWHDLDTPIMTRLRYTNIYMTTIRKYLHYWNAQKVIDTQILTQLGYKNIDMTEIHWY